MLGIIVVVLLRKGLPAAYCYVVIGIIGKALSGYNLGWVRALRTLVGRIHVACS